MEFTQEQIEDLKEQLLDNWYDEMDEKDLEIFYKDVRREYLDEFTDEELIEMFKANGLLDEEDDDEEDD